MQKVLNDLLNMIRLSGTVYFELDLAKPWGIKMSEGGYAQFHIVNQGKCLVKSASMKKPIGLNAGDIIAFPHGEPHWIADDSKSKKIPGQAVYESYQKKIQTFQSKRCDTKLVCGHFDFDSSVRNPFLLNLPEFILVKAGKNTDYLQKIASLIVEETRSMEFGSGLVTDKLAEVLFVALLRAYIANNTFRNPPWSSISHPQISKALQLIHRDFRLSLTVKSIAQEIGMSRSLFALRFRETVGTTPIEYLTGWRMQSAKDLLKKTDLSIYAIADRVGYVSEPAFSRAFKRQFSEPPGHFRKINR